MLSLQECRALIDNNRDLTDKEILEIRDDLYSLGELALEDYIKKLRNKGG